MRIAGAKRGQWLALVLLGAVVLFVYLVFVHPWWTAPMLEANADIAGARERELRVRTQLQRISR